MKIILVYPLAPSVENAVNLLFRDDENFTLQVARLEEFKFAAFTTGEPAIVLFSAIDQVTRTMIRKELERTPAPASVLLAKEGERPPFMRIVVLGEEPGGLAMQNWRQLNVHEFILAPIVPQALKIKLERHRKKIMQELAELQKIKPALTEPLIEAEKKSKRKILPLDASQADSDMGMKTKEFAVHGIVLGPNTFLFPKEEGTQDPRQVVVKCECPEIKETDGQWVKREETSAGKEGQQGAPTEPAWDWVYSEGKGAKKSSEEDNSFRFIGERPVFDKASGQWAFKGRSPLLFHNKSKQAEGAQEPGAPDAVFGYYSDCGLVMYKGDSKTETARVWFVRLDDFSNSPLRYYQKQNTVEKKRLTAAPGGVSDTPDAELLKALSDAIGRKSDDPDNSD